VRRAARARRWQDPPWIRGLRRRAAAPAPLAPSSQKDPAEDGMTCPYLKEVAMVFCRACPVKKLVPIDHITTASRCEGEAFKTCPLFQDALARTYQAAVDEDGAANGGGAGTP
jgi:hypothetical protein